MDKYERILFIDKLISSGSRPSQTDIIDALKVFCKNLNRTTVWRDLKELELKFHAPLDVQEYVDTEGKKKLGYIYTEPNFRVPAMFSSANKIKSAQLMTRLLSLVRGNPIYDEAFEVFKELSAEAPEIDGRGVANFKIDSAERIIFIGSPCIEVPKEIWNLVEEALQKNKIIKFTYKNELKERTIAPYQLIFSNGNWNLWGYEYSSKSKKLFNLDKISKVSFYSGKENTFILPENFDFRLRTPGYFGTFLSNETFTIKIRMKGYAAEYSRCRKWGENQQIKELENGENGEIELSFSTTQFSKDLISGPILSWILGWGAEAVPLEPKELVEIWKEKVCEMYKKLDFSNEV